MCVLSELYFFFIMKTNSLFKVYFSLMKKQNRTHFTSEAAQAARYILFRRFSVLTEILEAVGFILIERIE